MTPLDALRKTLAGGVEELGSISAAVRLLPQIAASLRSIEEHVRSMDEEVARMRQGVDSLNVRVDSLNERMERMDESIEGVRHDLRPWRRRGAQEAAQRADSSPSG